MTQRGFPNAEYHARLTRAQEAMQAAGISALLLTTEVDFRYFTGFLTRFWQSPSRPWYLVLPATGAPVAVIPTIGVTLMEQTWITNIRSWLSPDDDTTGLALLCDAIAENVPKDGIVALADGPETHMRMPLASFEKLRKDVLPRVVAGDNGLARNLRQIKSPAEVDKIRQACAIAGRAFDRVPTIAGQGVALDQVFRRFQMLCLESGADWVGYLAGGAGPGGYRDVISPATGTPLAAGDILMLDTGVVFDGYYCDFDRNFAISNAPGDAEGAYMRLMEATAAGLATAKPGASAADIHAAMDNILGVGPRFGRLGHGLGMELTEGLSIIPTDHTALEPGMVLTLEPGIPTRDGRIMVHEENIVITDAGAEYLSPKASDKLPVLT